LEEREAVGPVEEDWSHLSSHSRSHSEELLLGELGEQEEMLPGERWEQEEL
jgi:hypothetical protein